MFEVIDLTRLVNPNLEVEHEKVGTYADPPTIFDPYLDDYNERGYIITRLDMGAHVGTHCDVPIHVKGDGASISDLPASTFVGWAVVINYVGKGPVTGPMLKPHEKRVAGRPDVIPILRHGKEESLTPDARGELISWRPKVIVLGEGCNIDDRYEDTHAFLGADIPMIMNPDHTMIARVRDGDLIVAAPLKLHGLEAAPIRLLAIRGLPGQHTQATAPHPNIISRFLHRLSPHYI